MKLVFIPDSFKGTLSSERICALLTEKAQQIFPGCETVSIPVADGGEGSVDCFLAALGGDKVTDMVRGPFGEEMQAFYGLADGGKTAVIEMAACAGLPLVEGRRNPERTTTYGVGELIVHAAKHGAERIVIGLGGSATNDGGCGAAAAAGVRFYDESGAEFLPTGGTLERIARIDTAGLCSEVRDAELIAMCDIDNPMYGENGAAYVFGPQKGAGEACVKRLDAGLRHLSEILRRDTGHDVSCLPGAGAAGAMGAGMVALFGARLQMGIEAVLDTVRFSEVLQNADLVVTGEGKLDTQSLRGKVVIGVARRAKEAGKPVIALVGGAEAGTDEVFGLGVTAVFPINRLPEDFSVSRYKSEENLSATAENVFRLVRSLQRL